MKTSELLTLLGIILTLVMSIITQIITRKNIKLTKIVENYVNSKYLNIKDIRNLSISLIHKLNTKLFLDNIQEYNDIVLTIISLEIELLLFDKSEEILNVLSKIDFNVKSRYDIDYTVLTGEFINGIVIFLKTNSDDSRIHFSKIKSINNEWKFN